MKVDREWFLIPGIAALAIYLAKFIPQERIRIVVRAISATTIFVLVPIAFVFFLLQRACVEAFRGI